MSLHRTHPVSRHLQAAVVAALLLVTAAGCGSDSGGSASPDDPSEGASESSTEPSTEPATGVAPGDCVASPDGSVAADFPITLDGVVDCSEPHVYEVVGVVDIPSEHFPSADESERDRQLMDSALSSLATYDGGPAFQRWANETCYAAEADARGWGELTFNGLSAGETRALIVSDHSETWLTISTADEWAAGARELKCSVRYGPLGGAPVPVSSRVVETYLTDDYPAEFRSCGTYDANDQFSLVPCSEQHYQENFVVFDAFAAFGQEWVDASRAEVTETQYLPEAQDAEAIEVCRGVLDTVIGDGWDTTSMQPLAVPTRQGWFSGSDYFGLQCSVAPVDGLNHDLPGGSVVGIGDTPIERIPIAG